MVLDKTDSVIKWIFAVCVCAVINYIAFLYVFPRAANEPLFFEFKFEDLVEFVIIPVLFLVSWFLFFKGFRAVGVNSGLLLILGFLSIPVIFYTFILAAFYPFSFVEK